MLPSFHRHHTRFVPIPTSTICGLWVAGGVGGMTEADLRLFPTLFRFDPVYVARFLLTAPPSVSPTLRSR